MGRALSADCGSLSRTWGWCHGPCAVSSGSSSLFSVLGVPRLSSCANYLSVLGGESQKRLSQIVPSREARRTLSLYFPLWEKLWAKRFSSGPEPCHLRKEVILMKWNCSSYPLQCSCSQTCCPSEILGSLTCSPGLLSSYSYPWWLLKNQCLFQGQESQNLLFCHLADVLWNNEFLNQAM